MSLIASDKGSGSQLEILPEDTYSAVCYEVIDLGLQENPTFNKSQHKVLIGWELPDMQVEIDGETKPRIFSQRYTMSLSEKASLRKDLVAWRGKQFTDEELAGFSIDKLIGVPCLLQIVHTVRDGKTYANMGSITKLPKGMPRPQGVMEPIVFDLDTSPLSMIDEMPGWIQELIKKSVSYAERLANEQAALGSGASAGDYEELPEGEGGELPF